MRTPALFEADGRYVVPQDYARGPWSPDALHGGPVAGLVARAVERCAPDPDMLVTRLTVDLQRPVPMEKLEVRAELVRRGRKVQVVEVSVCHGDTELVHGRGLRVRLHGQGALAGQGLPPTGSTGDAPGAARPPAPPAGGRGSPPLVDGYTAFHNSGAELRFVAGDFDKQGP
ncbi:MAG: acyl-CoA thioesterase domain-containing protein, partial [Acidimicrobiales bacterium]